MLNEFNAECPLTLNAPEKWIRAILTELEANKPYEITSDMLSAIFAANSGSVITSVFPVESFNSLFTAIQNGKPLKATAEGGTCTVLSGNVQEYPSDDYKALAVEMYCQYDGDTGFFKFGIESLGGALRLYDKSFGSVSYTDL